MMANGHVEIHDPFSNHKDVTSSTNHDPKSTSDADAMEDTVEFRLLMVYASRRRPAQDSEPPATEGPVTPNGVAVSNGPSSPQAPAQTENEEKKPKKKKGWKRLSKILSCIKPQIEDKEPASTPANTPGVQERCGPLSLPDEAEPREADRLAEVVSRLRELVSGVPFAPPEIECDAPEDEVEKVIGLLLRETGDELNERELKNINVAAELLWNYNFFERLIKTLLVRMGLISPEPNALGPQASPKTQIAVTCEVTRRLSAVETLPMSRMLSHGARYLRDHYSSWAQQQGGYEEAFHSDEEEEDEVH